MSQYARRTLSLGLVVSLLALALAPTVAAAGHQAGAPDVAPTALESAFGTDGAASLDSRQRHLTSGLFSRTRESDTPPLLAAASGVPTIPTGLDGLALNRLVYLTWDDDPDAFEFNVYRKKSVETSFSLLGYTTTNEAFDGSVDNEYVYDYRVTAVSSDGTETAPSKRIRLDPEPPAPDRVSGVDRYETAVEVCAYNYESAETVVLASGAGFADALAAAPLAGLFQAPLLLTEPGSIPAIVLDELDRLGAKYIYVVGGVAAVSGSVSSYLQGLGYNVTRIGGNNRYHTAELITRFVVANGADGSTWTYHPETGDELKEVFICRGDVFPDALSIAPFAYSDVTPILLVEPGRVPVETMRAMVELEREALLITGGSAAVPDSTVDQLWGSVGPPLVGPNGEPAYFYRRFWGDDRYYTSVAVVQAFEGAAGPYLTLGLATGENFPDALGGGMACGRWFGALLLTDPAGLNRGAQAIIDRYETTLQIVEVFGGTSVVPETVVTEVEGILD